MFNLPGRNVHTIKKNTKDLVIASKETGLEVNAGTTKYRSRDQNAGRSHNIYSITIDNSSCERVEQFKYQGTTLTNQNSIWERN